MPQTKGQSAYRFVRRSRQLLQEEIWHHSMVEDRTLRGRMYSLLRVLSITVRGIMTKKMFSQAAALSYASLMSLGPIITLAIMISTFVLKDNPQDATVFLNKVVNFIAPSTTVGDKPFKPVSKETGAGSGTPSPTVGQSSPEPVDATSSGSASANPSDTETPKDQVSVNKQLSDLLNNFVASAHSRSVSVIGLLVLIFISIQMMVSIEKNFNNIWGVRRGRDMLRRVMLYWTVFSLGVLAAFTTATVLTVGAVGSVANKMPSSWNLGFLANFSGWTHVLGFFLLTLLLAVFYRYIPNTAVRWGPAFIGGLIVAICLLLNNDFSFLYVTTVLDKQSLYGSVGIIPILMFGLYIFWTMVLFGGVLTYSVQNANNITADRMWNQISTRTRRLLNLAAFIQIAHAFLHDEPGPTSEELANALRVPAALVNESIGRMMDLHLISGVEVENDEGRTVMRYQPGRPLHQLTLGQFHRALDVFGNSAGDDNLLSSDPVLPHYVEAMGHFEKSDGLDESFSELLADHDNSGKLAKNQDASAT